MLRKWLYFIFQVKIGGYFTGKHINILKGPDKARLKLCLFDDEKATTTFCIQDGTDVVANIIGVQRIGHEIWSIDAFIINSSNRSRFDIFYNTETMQGFISL